MRKCFSEAIQVSSGQFGSVVTGNKCIGILCTPTIEPGDYHQLLKQCLIYHHSAHRQIIRMSLRMDSDPVSAWLNGEILFHADAASACLSDLETLGVAVPDPSIDTAVGKSTTCQLLLQQMRAYVDDVNVFGLLGQQSVLCTMTAAFQPVLAERLAKTPAIPKNATQFLQYVTFSERIQALLYIREFVDSLATPCNSDQFIEARQIALQTFSELPLEVLKTQPPEQEAH